MASAQEMQTHGPPYAPVTAVVGGVPTVSVDVPIDAVFIALYLTFAITNTVLYRHNSKKGHKFPIMILLTGFCYARIGTNVLRIAWATRPNNASVAIVAQILNNAGVLILYIVNLLFAQRILRALQPRIGWNKALSTGFIVLYVLIACALIMVISTTVLTYYTLNTKIRVETGWILRGVILFLLVVAALPLVLLALAFGLPRSGNTVHFGSGSMRTKGLLVLIATCLCTWLAGFKAGTAWEAPRPRNDPAWYDSRASFYVFGFTFEILVLLTYIPSRVDHRFHVPNGSSKVRTYQIQGKRDTNEDLQSRMEDTNEDVQSQMEDTNEDVQSQTADSKQEV